MQPAISHQIFKFLKFQIHFTYSLQIVPSRPQILSRFPSPSNEARLRTLPNFAAGNGEHRCEIRYEGKRRRMSHSAELRVQDSGDVHVPATAEEETGRQPETDPSGERLFPPSRSRCSVFHAAFIAMGSLCLASRYSIRHIYSIIIEILSVWSIR